MHMHVWSVGLHDTRCMQDIFLQAVRHPVYGFELAAGHPLLFCGIAVLGTVGATPSLHGLCRHMHALCGC